MSSRLRLRRSIRLTLIVYTEYDSNDGLYCKFYSFLDWCWYIPLVRRPSKSILGQRLDRRRIHRLENGWNGMSFAWLIDILLTLQYRKIHRVCAVWRCASGLESRSLFRSIKSSIKVRPPKNQINEQTINYWRSALNEWDQKRPNMIVLDNMLPILLEITSRSWFAISWNIAERYWSD